MKEIYEGLVAFIRGGVEHRFEVKSLSDARAECSCGKWSIDCTGERTKDYLREKWIKHIEGLASGWLKLAPEKGLLNT